MKIMRIMIITMIKVNRNGDFNDSYKNHSNTRKNKDNKEILNRNNNDREKTLVNILIVIKLVMKMITKMMIISQALQL